MVQRSEIITTAIWNNNDSNMERGESYGQKTVKAIPMFIIVKVLGVLIAMIMGSFFLLRKNTSYQQEMWLLGRGCTGQE